VINRTFRSLDDAPKLVGFTIRQWAALIATSMLVLGFVHLTRMGAKPAITIAVFVIGLPAALTYVSESGGLRLGGLLIDMWRWRIAAKHLHMSRACETVGHGVLISSSSTPSGEPETLEQPRDAEDPGCWERWE
jgi:hypothetical protein